MTPLLEQEQHLYDLMLEISNTCYNIGWIYGLEYKIWDALDDNHFNFGYHIMDPLILKEIKLRSTILNGWIIWQDDTFDKTIPPEEWGPRFISMNEWKSILKKHNDFDT